MAIDLAQEYNNPDAAGDAGAPQQAQSQDLTIPGQAVAQIMQFIQAGDCQSVCKAMTDLLSSGAQAQ